MNLALAVKNARLLAIADAANAGADASNRATLTLYADPMPGGADVALAGQLELAVVECPYPLEASIENGVMTLGAFSEQMATGEGQATWARLRSVAGTAVADLTVGMEDAQGNPTAQITISQSQIYPGVLIDITEGLIAEA
ncbi:hypothetical protein SAMN04487957_10598 [Halomonas shengliensis]|uniref:Uncharacterized protein n=1 Tax=Halomonas shengliensis TaxID=419597 RepID=A0A1H0IFA1_9GAMM|nr:hypothetical protein [Halomonas shengliensis]SDO30045.1 hypothetical protein SAMN04487957_10598 [Halomonas shengliensis]